MRNEWGEPVVPPLITLWMTQAVKSPLLKSNPAYRCNLFHRSHPVINLGAARIMSEIEPRQDTY